MRFREGRICGPVYTGDFCGDFVACKLQAAKIAAKITSVNGFEDLSFEPEMHPT